MGRQRGFLPPATCQQCGKAPELGQHLWPGERWRCMACMESDLPGKDTISKSMTQLLAYAESMKEAFSLEAKSSTAQDTRNQAGWARMMAAEMAKQGTARAKQIADANREGLLPVQEKLLYDTMTVPDLVTIDAWMERSRLVLEYGGDVAAMAQDVSASIKAENSLEKMLAHQLAVAHKMVMELIGQARHTSHPEIEIQRLTVATRFMTSFQQGMLTLKKLRHGGQQKITVQYVNVSEGGQAVIGNIAKEG